MIRQQLKKILPQSVIGLYRNYQEGQLLKPLLEHIPDARAMRELHRVLKPGGWAIVQVPLDYSRSSTYEDFSITEPSAREKAFDQWDYVRWYGRDYPERLQQAGFSVTQDHFIDSFTGKEQVKYGFMRGEIIYIVQKS